uniref:BHLH domain-containing protein n=1 Tax=Ornithorhynchus anatinus TaxID=9258 RepID=A0A6I8NG88_ORNAN
GPPSTPSHKLPGPLRKPMVEKMPWDRIDSSIEQLKHLLDTEFLGTQPHSRLEKANILDTTVSSGEHRQVFGRRSKSPHQDYRAGITHCLTDSLLYLSLHRTSADVRLRMWGHFRKTPARVLAAQKNPPYTLSGRVLHIQAATPEGPQPPAGPSFLSLLLPSSTP